MKKQGFASLTPEYRKEIARRGGRAAHEKGTAHKWTTKTARKAGKKGGKKVSSDRKFMSRIGKLGGLATAAKK